MGAVALDGDRTVKFCPRSIAAAIPTVPKDVKATTTKAASADVKQLMGKVIGDCINREGEVASFVSLLAANGIMVQ